MKYRSGQTLLELVIAAGVISTATIAAITLIIRTMTVGQVSESKVEAINYAREGIEVVRMIRDSNWLSIDNNVTKQNAVTGDQELIWWNDVRAYGHNVAMGADVSSGAVAASGMDYTIQFRPSQMANGTGWFLVQCGTASTACASTDNRRYIWKCGSYDSNGSTNPTQPPNECTGGQKTKFRRVIHITQAQGADVDTVVIGSTTYTTSYLDVTSTVTWNQGGVDQQLVERTRLYNWR